MRQHISAYLRRRNALNAYLQEYKDIVIIKKYEKRSRKNGKCFFFTFILSVLEDGKIKME